MSNLIKIVTLIIFCFCSVPTIFGQGQNESLRDKLAKKQQQRVDNENSGIKQLSIRAEMMNKEQAQDISNASWVREIYRYLDLQKGRNAALYHPIRPEGDRMNLYTMIFKLMAEGKLTAYQFIDANRESFAESAKVNFKDILDNLQIPYQQNGNIFSIDEYNIPSNEVLGYYVKEAWYFDNTNSVLDIKVIAICPIIFRQDDYDIGSNRYPQFWIPYENIKPYAARMHIMTSDLNNVKNKTIDDFFRMNLYEGEIYKTSNMKNLVLTEMYKTPQELKEAQDKIETELKSVEKGLWVVNDSTYINPDSLKEKKKKEKKNKTAKPKKAPASYSARDRRN